MSKVRDMINAHLYPVLALFSVIYFSIQIQPMATEARSKTKCYKTATSILNTNKAESANMMAVAYCNGKNTSSRKPKKVTIQFKKRDQGTLDSGLYGIQ